MAIVENTGEVTFCEEIEVFNDYILADMIFFSIKDIYGIWEVNNDAEV